ncbi:hypothetical protein [Streptomyces sp. NPDC086787]|uniref:hypothetical protein n=1 Tax=Streptomyces sp. NPDC086787 TaxID=3365759 RepID=UPI00382F3F23
MRNRRGAAWALEARSWAGAKAVRVVSDRLAAWGFASPGCLEAVVRLLVATVVADGGRHVSLHLAEQDHTVLVLAFSHRAAPVGGGGCEEAGVLSVLRRLGADSCGTETASEGRQVWALLPLSAPIVSGGRGAPG